MRTIRTISLYVTMLAASLMTLSCNKSESLSPDPTPGSKVDICITGNFNTFSTKAEIENIFMMKWSNGDIVYVYGTTDGTAMINLGSLTAAVVSGTDNCVADLSGSITAPKAGTKLTLVYSPLLQSAPTPSSNAISIDLKSQGGKEDSVAFVAYTAVDYQGASSTYRVSFGFATSVLRVNVSGMGANLPLTKATIDSIETVCQLALNAAAAPTVSGTTRDTIIRNFPASVTTSDKGSVAFYVAVPAFTADARRELRVSEKDSSTYLFPKFATGTKGAGKMMNSITAIPTPIKYMEGTTDLGYGTFIPETGVIWAPVNCGYDATNYKYGMLYQWGRKYGQGYNGNGGDDGDYPGKSGGNQSLVDISSGALTSHPDGDTYNGNFYKGQNKWYGGTSPAVDKLWNSNEGTSDPVSKTAYDPCPEGWRVPTYSELNALIGNSGTTGIGSAGWDSANKGYWFNGTKSPKSGEGLLLPAGGRRRYDDGNGSDRDNYLGSYWSSSVSGNNAWMLQFRGGGEYPSLMRDVLVRGWGFSVRCVQE